MMICSLLIAGRHDNILLRSAERRRGNSKKYSTVRNSPCTGAATAPVVYRVGSVTHRHGTAMRVLLAGVLAAGLTAPLTAQQAPDGWTVAFLADADDPNARLRDLPPDRYLIARGDFDGDGAQDRASLSVRQSGREAAVLIHLAGRPGPPIVVQKLGADVISRMGIATVKPGVYRPGCARGVGIDCDPATRVTLPHDGVRVFTFESHSTYCWLEGDEIRSVIP